MCELLSQKSTQDFDLKLPKSKHEMTIFDQFRRENSNEFRFFLPLKEMSNDTKIKIAQISSFSRICSFCSKMRNFDDYSGISAVKLMSTLWLLP